MVEIQAVFLYFLIDTMRHTLGRALASIVLVLSAQAAFAGCGSNDSSGGTGNPSGVGSKCSVNADCPTNNCYPGPAGGYCTAECKEEGETKDCPVDTVCKPIQGGPKRCLLICRSPSTCGDKSCGDGYCPSGSSCTSVAKTDLRACEPSPK